MRRVSVLFRLVCFVSCAGLACLVANAKPGWSPLPLSFEENQGQARAGVRFVAHSRGYEAALSGSGVTMTLGGGPVTSTVSMTLEGAATTKDIVGEQPLPGKVNYLLGS